MSEEQFETWWHDEYCLPMYRAAAMAITKYDHMIEAGKKGMPYPVPFLTGKGGKSLLGLMEAIEKADCELGARIRSEYEALKKMHDLSDEWFRSH